MYNQSGKKPKNVIKTGKRPLVFFCMIKFKTYAIAKHVIDLAKIEEVKLVVWIRWISPFIGRSLMTFSIYLSLVQKKNNKMADGAVHSEIKKKLHLFPLYWVSAWSSFALGLLENIFVKYIPWFLTAEQPCCTSARVQSRFAFTLCYEIEYSTSISKRKNI